MVGQAIASAGDTGVVRARAGASLTRLLDATGALYLDTQESRGLVPADHPSIVAAVRAAAITEADVVLLVGRKLDYQVGYGSPAVFPHARFIRVADNPGELIDNRRGQPELLAAPDLALAAMVEMARNRESNIDKTWADGLRRRHRERAASADPSTRQPLTGPDGKIHPRAIFDVIADLAEPDYIAIADGGDLLSFARTGLRATTYMDDQAPSAASASACRLPSRLRSRCRSAR